MRNRIHIGVAVFCLGLFSVIFIGTRKTSHIACPDYVAAEPRYNVPIHLRDIKQSSNKDHEVLHKILKDERNRLSKGMNDLRKQLGQQECEKNEEKEDTNAAGGWCRQTSMEDGGQHMTDMVLVKALSKFFKGKTVGSFGDGPGAYKREIMKLEEVKRYDAFDGAPFCEETSNGLVKFLDLTVPQYGLPMYDWILSIEVAEHIPKEFEPVYIDNLIRHSKEGIILSWAVPGQGGLAHINTRPFSYVIDLMKFHKFTHDNASSTTLKYQSSLGWLRDNINVFKREPISNLSYYAEWFA